MTPTRSPVVAPAAASAGPGPAAARLAIPSLRVQAVNGAPVRPERDWVLYWMVAQRRTTFNFGLQHAVAEAARLGRPLLVFEALRLGYRWASPRIHQFVVEGMVDNAAACAAAGVTYRAYVEPEAGAGAGLLAALAARACAVVTDEFPCFFVPHMVAAAGRTLDVRLEAVDGNGLLPLRATERVFTTAASFRRHLHKTLPDHLDHFPVPEPLAEARHLGRAVVPPGVDARWPAPDLTRLGWLGHLPLALSVPPVPAERGGSVAGAARARAFVAHRLARYHTDRNRVVDSAASGLSAHLHFGHVGVHALARAVLDGEDWRADRLAPTPTGSREGWWGLSAAAEAFIDEAVTWRELGYVFCHHRPDDYDRYESLPDWAQETLDLHAGDHRPHRYDLDALDAGRTHDPLWNAAQGELRTTGRIHNYLRMLWGKKILEWTGSPREALAVLTELNNRYALDGRNPNSYSGIFWTLGRFDRAWGPERPIFGKIRYMTSDSTRRKLDVTAYIQRFARGAASV